MNDGSRYQIEKTLAYGSYGTTAIVRNSATNELFCLKRQTPQDEDDELDCFKEAMMHHILDLHTRPFEDYRSDLIPRLYQVVRSQTAGGPIIVYFIMDLMSTSLSNRISAIKTYHGRLLEFVRCLAHITPTLRKLYAKGLYNHGDLHMGNVMYDQDYMTYKIIDYGFSRIQIGTGARHHVLVLNEKNARSDESRDLTQLIVAFEMSYGMNDLHFTEGSFEHAVQQMIKSVVYDGHCSGVGHHDHLYDFIQHGWSSSYRHFNTHTNVNGTHNMIQMALNALPRSDRVSAPPAPVSRVSSSAVVRTPHPVRIAPREPEEAALQQINRLSPGCMLLYIMFMFLAFRGMVGIYYGRGGRDPNVNSMVISNLSEPVLSNQYSIVPFHANHSIQNKFRSKNHSSKTRTNRSISKRNTTRRRFNHVPQVTIEDFDKLSLASFYHYLRFHAFPHVSQKNKMEMLRKAAMVPLQQANVFAQIVKAVHQNDMDQMMEILQKNKLELGDVKAYQKVWNHILDAYFEEKDSPNELLQTLLHMGSQLDDFLSRYRSANQETKKMMVMQTCITASDAPELMLE